ncbi:hypothetical protein [Rhizobium johnstonii]|uniref:hypothetical protein n=1 Tax=Rhizobium johnstonii TaxID=3019933 RepID=UPI003F9AE3CF
MSWYITIHPPQTQLTSDTEQLVEFLKTLPELQQLRPASFGSAPGQPWLDVTIAKATEAGNWSSDGSFIPRFDRVELVCSARDPRQDWYDELAARIAKFLGWVAVEEHTKRVIWPSDRG